MDNTRWKTVQSDPLLIFLSGNQPTCRSNYFLRKFLIRFLITKYKTLFLSTSCTFGLDFVPFRSRPPEMIHSVNVFDKVLTDVLVS